MKLHAHWQNDGKYHQYCIHCRKETIRRITDHQKTYYYCTTCKQQYDRSLVIDPGVKWWVTNDGEYWHESAGIFLRNPLGQFLFYERTIFPFALTVPSGHVDTGEASLTAALRELEEEVGIHATELIPIANESIVGDSCRRGSDSHQWHAYLLPLQQMVDIQIKEEGEQPTWLPLAEALQKNLTYPVQYIIRHFQDDLIKRDFHC